MEKTGEYSVVAPPEHPSKELVNSLLEVLNELQVDIEKRTPVSQWGVEIDAHGTGQAAWVWDSPDMRGSILFYNNIENPTGFVELPAMIALAQKLPEIHDCIFAMKARIEHLEAHLDKQARAEAAYRAGIKGVRDYLVAQCLMFDE